MVVKEYGVHQLKYDDELSKELIRLVVNQVSSVPYWSL